MSRDTLFEVRHKIGRAPDAVLDDLRHAAAKVGGPMSWKAYDDHRPPGSLSGIRVLQRFGGSWKDACTAAGVEPGGQGRAVYERKHTEEQCWDAAAAYLADPDAVGSYADFARWCSDNREHPSAQTVRNRLGSWNEIKRHFIGAAG